jgi:hypothetical protein
MFNACCNVLQKSGCKWLMFNCWTKQFEEQNLMYDIPQYIFNNTTIDRIIEGKEYIYWNKKEHENVSGILFDKLNELYG